MSGAAHGDHLEDAENAALFFAKHEDELTEVNAVIAEYPISLIGAAALWSGWSSDTGILSEPTLVIKPSKAFEGQIDGV